MFRPAAPVPVSIIPTEGAPAPADDGPDPLPPDALRAVAGLLGEGGVVHRPCFARVFGGAACGLLLSQFWFWSSTPTVRGRADGWFWKSQREITDETGLSRAETETARRRLRALGVLEEERRGIPATLHFRVDAAAVQRRLWGHVQAHPAPVPSVPSPSAPAPTAPGPAPIPQTGLRDMRTLVRGSVANKFARSPQTNTERTSERTQMKTQTGARPVSPAALGRGAFGPPMPLPSALAGTTVGAAISVSQSAVNRSGAARLKAALDAARKTAGRPGGDAPPDGSAARAGP